MSLLDSCSRIAFASLVHDIGKFAYRSNLSTDFDESRNEAFEALVKVAPDLFTTGLTESFDTHLLDTCIELAEIATGGLPTTQAQNENNRSRLVSLLEQIRLTSNKPQSFAFCHRLSALTPESLFALERQKVTPISDKEGTHEYRQLWDAFTQALTQIPSSHKKQWPLWLDHFDTAWLTFASNIPSISNQSNCDLSLYDQGKSRAAVAVALWRWHKELEKTSEADIERMEARKDWSEKKLLLIQGDFFGIQDFIFSRGAQTQKASAKLLRGRSFYVSLLTELAALKVLESLELPTTSQIINAAGKFMIVAHNTPETKKKLAAVQAQLDQWFIKNTLATGGIGLAAIAVSCEELSGQDEKGGLSQLVKKLFEALEVSKLQRLNLVNADTAVLEVNYSDGVSPYDDRLPKDSPVPHDQILIGNHLVKNERILVLNSKQDVREGLVTLELPIFDYVVGFANNEDVDGKFGALVQNSSLRRCWDFSMPERSDEILWGGYARRNINGYVSRFKDIGELSYERYKDQDTEGLENAKGLIKPFNFIACDQRKTDEHGFVGVAALTALKGDVDHLGQIFQKGLSGKDTGRRMTFAKMMALSRLMNLFFAVYLPVLCKKRFPNTYTVFAGGDDFFLIGPWKETQDLAYELHLAFKRFANNPEVHFSCGLIMVKSSVPVRTLAEMAEHALSTAKDSGRNAVMCHQQTVSWDCWDELMKVGDYFDAYSIKYGISTSYMYSLFEILDLAEQRDNPEASIWRSRLFYKTVRMAADTHNEQAVNDIKTEFIPTLFSFIERFGQKIRIPLGTYFYLNRRN